MNGDWTNSSLNESPRYRLALPPLFDCEVFERDGWWRATMNGLAIGEFQTVEQAKARCDWEVWNRVRCFREGYRRVLERRESWEHGWQ